MRTWLWLLLLTGWAWAIPLDKVENPRQRDSTWVTDQAHLLSPAAISRLNDAVAALERDNGTEVAVVTIDDTDGRTPKEFSTALFNRWGVGKKGKDNGVLFLVVVARHRVEVEVGVGARHHFSDADSAQILKDRVVPHFQAKRFEQGIESGVSGVLDRLHTWAPVQRTAAPPPEVAHTPHRSDPELVPVLIFFALALSPFVVVGLIIGWVAKSLFKPRRPIDGPPASIRSGWGTWLVVPPVLLGGFFFMGPVVALAAPVMLYGTYRLIRYRPRRCPHCRARLKLLDEVADDAYLLPGQLTEERTGSIDYDVHVCPGCDYSEVQGWTNYLSGFRMCSACERKTFRKVSDEVTMRPTTSFAGCGRREFACQNCRHRETQTYTIAKLSQSASDSSSSSYDSSSSSSSSSFGGGSSDGGGSGASW